LSRTSQEITTKIRSCDKTTGAY